eukprot:tig00020878_g14863.t1
MKEPSEKEIKSFLRETLLNEDLDQLTVKMVLVKLNAEPGTPIPTEELFLSIGAKILSLAPVRGPERVGAYCAPAERFSIDFSEKKKKVKAWLEELMNEEEKASSEEDAKKKTPKRISAADVARATATPQRPGSEKKAKATPSASSSKSASKSGRSERSERRAGGFPTCKLSEKLTEFLGVDSLTRGEVVKAIWDYIKERGLQNPNNKREIHCDARLTELLGVDKCTMFSINKFLAPHIQGSDGKGKRKMERGEGEDGEGGEGKERKKRKPSGGLAKLCALSPSMAAFLGVDRLPRTEVVKRIWAYIKEKELQDPKDKRNIICDETLSAAFKGAKKMTMFSMNKLLSQDGHVRALEETTAVLAKEEEEEEEEDEEEGEEEEEEEGGAAEVPATKQEPVAVKQEPAGAAAAAAATAAAAVAAAAVKKEESEEEEGDGEDEDVDLDN